MGNEEKAVHKNSRNHVIPKLVIALLSVSVLSFSLLRLRPQRSVICSETRNIYTVNAEKPRVECLGISGSEIVATGTLDDVRNTLDTFLYSKLFSPLFSTLYGIVHPPSKVVYIDPTAIIVPGLSDTYSRCACSYTGEWLQDALQLDTATSITEVIERIKTYIKERPNMPEDRWIEGMGWNQVKWPGGHFPTAADLDADPILRGRPIALRRVDGHATWVSTRVLELMGDLPAEVDGGSIVRDDEGKPTGIFVDNAIDLIPAPEWSEEQLSEYFNTTMTSALSYGLTSIHDADTVPQYRRFFIKQAEAGNIPLRIYAMLNGNYEVPENGQLLNHGKHGRLTIRSVKLYTDGALGSWGAALIKPYSDKPDTEGIMRKTKDEMDALIRKYWKGGWQVNVHCIGDRANNVVLNIFEDILQGRSDDVKGNVTTWRPRIEHAQIMLPSDIKRAGDLGVIMSVQPTHGTSDMAYAETRLGSERIKGAYAWRTQLRSSSNGVIPLGSDFPVEGVNPLLGFYAAVSRLAPDGSSPHGKGGWYPSERLTREQALKGMTLDAAYASFTEGSYGSLEPGKKAEFVVLDRDIMAVPFDEILKTKVRATVIDGQVVYGKL